MLFNWLLLCQILQIPLLEEVPDIVFHLEDEVLEVCMDEEPRVPSPLCYCSLDVLHGGIESVVFSDFRESDRETTIPIELLTCFMRLSVALGAPLRVNKPHINSIVSIVRPDIFDVLTDHLVLFVVFF